MAISSHSNSNSIHITPRFTIGDLYSIDNFINALERNGCHMVSKSQLEDMSNSFLQRPVTEYDYMNQAVYCPSSIDRTLYSMESNYYGDCMDLETDFHISNLDGVLVEVRMRNGHISGISKLDMRIDMRMLHPEQLVEFLEDYVKYHPVNYKPYCI